MQDRGGEWVVYISTSLYCGWLECVQCSAVSSVQQSVVQQADSGALSCERVSRPQTLTLGLGLDWSER